MCWFGLFRNMWGFLSISHATITANENLSNKSYFSLVLIANLSDLLIPVYAKSIILGIFDPVYPFTIWHLTGSVGRLLGETDFWKISCFFNSLGIWMFDHFRDRRSLTDWNFLCMRYGLRNTDHIRIILCCNSINVTWRFSRIFFKIWSEPSILEGNILQCTTF